MSRHDDADLAAIRVLEQLVEREAIEFVSTRGVSTLAPAVASFLLRHEGDPERAAVLAAWLIDHLEVRDLYIDDEQLEQLLRDVWDPGADASKPAIEARREDLEALLRNEPDNLDHRAVYGDWLQSHRDPLGELIARQLAAAYEPDNPALEQAATSYLREHAHALFGPLAEYLDSVLRLKWRGGFIEAAAAGKLPDDSESYEGALLLRLLLEHRTAMLLRELELHPFERFWSRDQLRNLLGVVLAQPRPLLRRLTVGDDETTGELGELAPLDELLPNLEILELRVRSVSIERSSLPKLRRLIWRAPIGPRQAAAMASSELPALRWLQVPGTADNVEWLADAPWRAGLEHLDLSGGSLDDDDARLLARLPWPRLQHLDVSNNELGTDGVARLQALAPTVVTAEQRVPDRLDDEYDARDDDDYEDDDEYYESAME